MEERKLASIQKCLSIEPIEGADRIQLARVLGWQCVVRKGEFNVGDLGVFFEIDSVLPKTPVFEFMKDRKYRVRTIKLKGTLSQGLFLPISSFGFKKAEEGDNVTLSLGVEKYERPEDKVPHMAFNRKRKWYGFLYRIPFIRDLILNRGKGAVEFPTHLVPKTDEIRLQTLGEEFLKQYKDVPISVTRKMDGQSGTFVWYKNKFTVASRNLWYQYPKDNNYWKVAKKTELEKVLKEVAKGKNIAIQGEICGPGIQGNKYKFTELELFIYGIYDIDNQRYFTPYELHEFVTTKLIYREAKVFLIPNLIKYDSGYTVGDIGTTVKEWLEYATRKSHIVPEVWDEGIVVRSIDNKPYNVRNMNSKRFSFKVVSNEFLLEYGE